jgi:hypothetical protein
MVTLFTVIVEAPSLVKVALALVPALLMTTPPKLRQHGNWTRCGPAVCPNPVSPTFTVPAEVCTDSSPDWAP